MKPLIVTVAELPHSGVLAGPVRVVHPALKLVGCAWQYDPLQHAYKVPRARLDDVVAAIEMGGHIVEAGPVAW